MEDVFYLEVEEVLNAESLLKSEPEFLKRIIAKRKIDYSLYEKVKLPVHFSTSDGELPLAESVQMGEAVKLKASPASPGRASGRVKIFESFYIPENINFEILVTSHTDPGWTSLIALSKGLIIEHGGMLSHASIVARELRIPTVIGASNAVSLLKDGQMDEIDGSTGDIKLI